MNASLGTGVTDDSELLCQCWETNPGPFKNNVCSEPSLHALPHFFFPKKLIVTFILLQPVVSFFFRPHLLGLRSAFGAPSAPGLLLLHADSVGLVFLLCFSTLLLSLPCKPFVTPHTSK